MRKNALIKLLENIEGNPEIVLWDVRDKDYQHIDPIMIEGTVEKPTFEFYAEMCRLSQCIALKDDTFQFDASIMDKIKKSYASNVYWEDITFTKEDGIKDKNYKTKRVVYIQSKPRKSVYSDLLGSIEF